MGLSVLAVGNPFDGIRIIGPFANGEEAHEWADRNLSGEDWCVALDSPDDNEWTRETALAEEN
jgi:hypothetical protein